MSNDLEWRTANTEWQRPDGVIVVTDDMEFWRPIIVTWQPHEDITTYELARAMPYLLAPDGLSRRVFDALPPNVQRHFVVRELREAS